MVGGMDFLSDGRLVIGHWGGTRTACCPSNTNFGGRQYTGKIYILSGVTGTTPSVVIDSSFATGLEDVMGLTVIRDTIYVSGGNNIIRLIDSDHNGVADRKDTLFELPGTPQISSTSTTAPGPGPYNDSLHPTKGRSEWLYGLLARNDTFFVNPSSMYNANNIQQVNPYRGTFLAVTRGNGVRGNYQIRSMGLRHPTGLTFGPEGTIWTCETQGHWVPTDKLIQLKTGAFYGFHHTPAESWDNMTETPAAVFLPQEGSGGSGAKDATGIFADSPGQPFYLTDGPYAGQFLMGDVSWGGIQRFFVEKVGNDYQGAGFVFTGGLESGVYRMAQGPDGMLYLGMIGTSNDWSWNGQYYGLQKIKYNGTPTFEMLAVRSRAAGMEIEFTKPVDTLTARIASNYTVQTYYYTPTSSYGGTKAGTTPLTVTQGTIQFSPDLKSVYLPLSGLVARTGILHRIVEITLANGLKSSTGDTSWTKKAYYSLNAISPSAPFSTTTAIDPKIVRADMLKQLRCKLASDNLVVKLPFAGAYDLRLLDARGAVLTSTQGRGAEEKSLPLRNAHGKFVVVEAYGDGMNLRRTVALP
jgi:hypothetical protein